MKRFLNSIFALPKPGGAALWKRLVYVEIGLILCGIGFSILVRAMLGLDPWDVFHQGLSEITGISFGTIVVLVSFAVMFFWIFLRQKLGLGTILNALTIGFVMDLLLPRIPEASNFWWGLGYFLVAVFIAGFGTAMYVGAGLGPGPRDGLMTGLVRITGLPVWLVRTGIEVIVLIIGWFLGGTVGLGTVLFALMIGPIVHVFMPILALDKAVVKDLEDKKEANELEGH